MKYECIACGYIYDEAVEGVKFEDLPTDWVCPLCGVGKDMFKKVEELECFQGHLPKTGDPKTLFV